MSELESDASLSPEKKGLEAQMFWAVILQLVYRVLRYNYKLRSFFFTNIHNVVHNVYELCIFHEYKMYINYLIIIFMIIMYILYSFYVHNL